MKLVHDTFDNSFLEKRLISFFGSAEVNDGGGEIGPKYSARIRSMEDLSRDIDNLDSVDRQLEALKTELSDELGITSLQDLDIKGAVSVLADMVEEFGSGWSFNKLGGVDAIKIVLLTQVALAGTPFDCGEIDGLYGSSTKAGLRKLQESQQCKFVDGIPGPETIGAILSYRASDMMEALVEANPELEQKFKDEFARFDMEKPSDDLTIGGLTFSDSSKTAAGLERGIYLKSTDYNGHPITIEVYIGKPPSFTRYPQVRIRYTKPGRGKQIIAYGLGNREGYRSDGDRISPTKIVRKLEAIKQEFDEADAQYTDDTAVADAEET